LPRRRDQKGFVIKTGQSDPLSGDEIRRIWATEPEPAEATTSDNDSSPTPRGRRIGFPDQAY
jgi:hypothetical protein